MFVRRTYNYNEKDSLQEYFGDSGLYKRSIEREYQNRRWKYLLETYKKFLVVLEQNSGFFLDNPCMYTK